MFKLLLLGFVVLSCVQKLNAQLEKDDSDDLHAVMADVRSLINELAGEKRLRGILEDEMTVEMTEEKKLRGKLEDEIAALTDIAVVNKNMIQTLNEQLSRKLAGEIAFFVHTQSSIGPVTEDTKIPFPYENVNNGGGWNPAIDAFQAPIAGYYFFAASIASQSGTQPFIGIVHTDASASRTVASMLASGSQRNGDTKNVILYLEQDDYVSVQLRSQGSGIAYSSSNIYTTFSGFLLYV